MRRWLGSVSRRQYYFLSCCGPCAVCVGAPWAGAAWKAGAAGRAAGARAAAAGAWNAGAAGRAGARVVAAGAWKAGARAVAGCCGLALWGRTKLPPWNPERAGCCGVAGCAARVCGVAARNCAEPLDCGVAPWNCGRAAVCGRNVFEGAPRAVVPRQVGVPVRVAVCGVGSWLPNRCRPATPPNVGC